MAFATLVYTIFCSDLANMSCLVNYCRVYMYVCIFLTIRLLSPREWGVCVPLGTRRSAWHLVGLLFERPAPWVESASAVVSGSVVLPFALCPRDTEAGGGGHTIQCVLESSAGVWIPPDSQHQECGGGDGRCVCRTPLGD